MFKNQRYLTRGVYSEIPIELQLFMWECIDKLLSEQPEYRMEYLLPTISNPVTAKVYVIDDGDHSTMLLAEEY